MGQLSPEWRQQLGHRYPAEACCCCCCWSLLCTTSCCCPCCSEAPSVSCFIARKLEAWIVGPGGGGGGGMARFCSASTFPHTTHPEYKRITSPAVLMMGAACCCLKTGTPCCHGRQFACIMAVPALRTPCCQSTRLACPVSQAAWFHDNSSADVTTGLQDGMLAISKPILMLLLLLLLAWF